MDNRSGDLLDKGMAGLIGQWEGGLIGQSTPWARRLCNPFYTSDRYVSQTRYSSIGHGYNGNTGYACRATTGSSGMNPHVEQANDNCWAQTAVFPDIYNDD